jgi:AsmA protein
LVSRITGNGSLTDDTVVYDDLTLKNVKSTVTLDHGLITVKPLTADLYNGQQTGTAVIDTRSTPPTYTVDSKLQNVDANQLLSAVSPLKQTLYGLLSANADTHFTTAAGAQSILPTLNGKISLNLKDGKIANVDLLHELASIAQFQRTASAVEPFTKLIQLTGDFDIHNGVARTNNLKAAIDEGSLAAQGIVDLANQKLDLRLTAALSQAFSQSVGGTGIGGFLNTALANNKGELVIPVVVTGTFRQPSFAPDLQAVAEMKLHNLVPDVSNPAGLTNGILGQILRGKPSPPASQPGQNQQAPPTNPLNNLFDLFGNKKRQ